MRKYGFATQLDSDEEVANIIIQLLHCKYNSRCLRCLGSDVVLQGSHELHGIGILHRNITIRSCGFRTGEDGQLIGVLCHFDYAIFPPYNGPSSNFRVGTSFFMPAEHLIDPLAGYYFRHEMESYLYCCVWFGVGYRDLFSKMPKNGEKDVLMHWRRGTRLYLNLAKRGLLKGGLSSYGMDLMKDTRLKEVGDAILQGLDTDSPFFSCMVILGPDNLKECNKECCGPNAQH